MRIRRRASVHLARLLHLGNQRVVHDLEAEPALLPECGGEPLVGRPGRADAQMQPLSHLLAQLARRCGQQRDHLPVRDDQW